MNDKNQGLEEIELLRDAVIAIVAMARDADSDRVKLAMDILLAGTSQLGTIFQQRCAQLGQQKQSRKAKAPPLALEQQASASMVASASTPASNREIAKPAVPETPKLTGRAEAQAQRPLLRLQTLKSSKM